MYKNNPQNVKNITKKAALTAVLTAVGVVLLWIGLWAIAAHRVGYDFILPSPLSVLKKLFEIITEKGFFLTVLLSLLRVLWGFILGAVIGLIGAFLSYLLLPLKIFFSPLIKIVRATPVASFILIAVLWIPSGTVPVFISFLMVFPIVYTNVLTGLENADKGLGEVTKIYRFSLWKRIKLFYLPSSLPYFGGACITSLGLAWKSSVAAEVLCVTKNSIGEKLYLSNIYLESAELLAWTVTVVLLSVGMEALIKLVAAKVKKGARRQYEGNQD